MGFYLGRQPILDRGRNVVGYELLFRSGETSFCDSADAVTATSQVIMSAILGVGLDRLLGGKPAFVNFDRTLLLGDWTTLLPPGKSVVEIVGTVEPDEEVFFACRKLRLKGYALALDDCRDDARTAAFAPFVDILKVDFQQTSPDDQQAVVRYYRKLQLRMVAKKVETEPEFGRALHLGYEYFQGYFFDRPTLLRAARVPTSRISALRLVRQIQREDLDFVAIEELIRNEASFSNSFLAYVNSGAFQWRDRVESIGYGLVLLGADEIRKWVWIACLSSLGESRPKVLIAQALMRGHFCEEIARSSRLSLGISAPFLLGTFSLLDAILERPLDGILDDLDIDENIQDALLGAVGGEENPLTILLRTVKSYETGDWSEVEAAARIFGLSADALNTCYLESLSWVDKVISPYGSKPRLDLPSIIDFRRSMKVAAGNRPNH